MIWNLWRILGQRKQKFNYLAGMDAGDSCKMKYYFPGVLRILFFYFPLASLMHSPVLLKGAHESTQYSQQSWLEHFAVLNSFTFKLYICILDRTYIKSLIIFCLLMSTENRIVNSFTFMKTNSFILLLLKLIYVKVWQKPLQYYKIIALQLK